MFCQCFRAVAEKIFKLGNRAQVEFRVGAALAVRLFEALAVLDGHQAVLEAVPFTDVVVDVAGGGHAGAGLPGQFQQGQVARRVPVSQVVLELDIVVIDPEPVQVPPDKLPRRVRGRLTYQLRQLAFGAAGEGDKALGVGGEEGGV